MSLIIRHRARAWGVDLLVFQDVREATPERFGERREARHQPARPHRAATGAAGAGGAEHVRCPERGFGVVDGGSPLDRLGCLTCGTESTAADGRAAAKCGELRSVIGAGARQAELAMPRGPSPARGSTPRPAGARRPWHPAPGALR